ncbi:hypothetical protein CRM22_011277 [Opisthorchis felineus]|uniref:Uncharacterized protein n=1 Tax=Opisthorchis felineus TaxID=147828 RepID=A0A4S2JQP2_OPIFE|nr:hypothetical protein CRM22_011277 [Opisthorchis felineus]
MRGEPNVDRAALLSDARDEDKVEAVRTRPPRARLSNKWNKFWIACLVGTGLLASVFMLLGASYILQLYSFAVQRLRKLRLCLSTRFLTYLTFDTQTL